eukprot:4558393-Lingulodinium_polyedra.AAC.1
MVPPGARAAVAALLGAWLAPVPYHRLGPAGVAADAAPEAAEPTGAGNCAAEGGGLAGDPCTNEGGEGEDAAPGSSGEAPGATWL